MVAVGAKSAPSITGKDEGIEGDIRVEFDVVEGACRRMD